MPNIKLGAPSNLTSLKLLFISRENESLRLILKENSIFENNSEVENNFSKNKETKKIPL